MSMSLSSFFTRLSRTAPPFEFPLQVLVVADPTTATGVARPLRAAKATVEVMAELSGPPRSNASILLLDLTVHGAWDWLRHQPREIPVIVMVQHEATGLRALLAGADGVLNVHTMHPREIVGAVARVAQDRRRKIAPVPNCEFAEEMRQNTERVLHAIDATLAHCGK